MTGISGQKLKIFQVYRKLLTRSHDFEKENERKVHLSTLKSANPNIEGNNHQCSGNTHFLYATRLSSLEMLTIFFKMRLKVPCKLLRLRPNFRLKLTKSQQSRLVAWFLKSQAEKVATELLRFSPNLRLKCKKLSCLYKNKPNLTGRTLNYHNLKMKCNRDHFGYNKKRRMILLSYCGKVKTQHWMPTFSRTLKNRD